MAPPSAECSDALKYAVRAPTTRRDQSGAPSPFNFKSQPSNFPRRVRRVEPAGAVDRSLRGCGDSEASVAARTVGPLPRDRSIVGELYNHRAWGTEAWPAATKPPSAVRATPLALCTAPSPSFLIQPIVPSLFQRVTANACVPELGTLPPVTKPPSTACTIALIEQELTQDPLRPTSRRCGTMRCRRSVGSGSREDPRSFRRAGGRGRASCSRRSTSPSTRGDP